MIVKTYILILLSCLCFYLPASIEAHSPIKANIIAEEQTVQPGRPFWVAVQFQMEDGWHIYWKNPGDAGMPVKVEWVLPPNMEVISQEWGAPERFGTEGLTGFGYSKETSLLVQISPSKSLDLSKDLEIVGNVYWLVCSDSTCLPGSEVYSLTLKPSAEIPKLNSLAEEIFTKARAQLPQPQTVNTSLRKDGKLQVEIPTFDGSPYTKIDFFPEDKSIINHASPVSFLQDDDNLLIQLDGMANSSEKSLKGVIVFETENNERRALQIDSPIDLGEVAILTTNNSKAPAPSSSFAVEQSLLWTLLFAFIGGSILNLMPCVLPVLSFKVMSFVKMAGESRLVSFKHGALFSVGVLLSFWVLAGLILGLQSYGSAVGWGFQLQEPLFVAGLASFLLLFALSSFGVFELGMGVASMAGEASSQRRSENLNSFFGGVLATAVATPCTGPFLGTVMGIAVTLPFIQSLSIFTAVALGLCAPYLILSGFPSLLRFIPKPGPWMETFKQLMGFLLLATVLWLLWVFSAETNSLAVFCLLGSFLLFSIAAWIFGHWATPVSSQRTRWIAYVVSMLFVVGGITLIVAPRSTWVLDEKHPPQWKDDGWEVFSPERVIALQKQGIPVLIDFTAKWCLICQANHMVLSSDTVDQKLVDAGVVKMKADWTKNDPVITKALAEFGRNSVPLYVLYGADGEQDPQILPQVLTPDIVMNFVDDAVSNEKIN